MPRIAKNTTGSVTRHQHKLGELKVVKPKFTRGKSVKKRTKARKSEEAKKERGLRVAKLVDVKTIKRKAQRFVKDAALGSSRIAEDMLELKPMIDRL